MRAGLMIAALAGLMGVALAQTTPPPATGFPIPGAVCVVPPAATGEPCTVVQTVYPNNRTILLVYYPNDQFAFANLSDVNWRDVPEAVVGTTQNVLDPRGYHYANPLVKRYGNPYFPYFQIAGNEKL